ncbi:MAG: hypothetical protein KAT58_02785 [candidate division Zixibacteria bacterium]|nr:hypothetical protein [candidate division Zixibacteria bacterium]
MNCTRDFGRRYNTPFGWLLAVALLAFVAGSLMNSPPDQGHAYEMEAME